MKTIGLTGGIASGKTTVSKILQEFGVPVIDADMVYSRLTQNGKPVWQAVLHTFGKKYFRPDGELDRKALGSLVFQNSKAREKLNRITHPIVKDEMLRIRKYIEQEQNPPLIVMDVPLLFESGWHQWMDEVWVVAVPKKMQIARLMQRDGLTREEALLRIHSQLDMEEKRKMAHRVIDNSQSISETKDQIKKILSELDFWRN
ncbi:MAG TPA: dephospho-CoA kinase [Clostridiales bacterium]|jgi:dephospho-CoA kinase|nr:dephospho-CoA kinase [Clostridiales bacterium]